MQLGQSGQVLLFNRVAMLRSMQLSLSQSQFHARSKHIHSILRDSLCKNSH